LKLTTWETAVKSPAPLNFFAGFVQQ